MEKLSLYFTDETAFSSDGFSVLPGHLASLPSEALVECSQPCRTSMLSRYDSVYVCGVCGLSVMMLEHFPPFSFKLFCFFPEELRMCLKGTGLLSKLKELEKLFCTGRL